VLRYTGHPIADVGVATVCAFSEKPDPESITADDLKMVADFLDREYFSGKLISYLTCVFPNSAYVNPNIGTRKKDEYRRYVLHGFQSNNHSTVSGFTCAFSGAAACELVYRQHVPLLTGEDVLNFFPGGTPGLPISSEFLLAIQAFPLGARRSEGRALAVHCPDDQSVTYDFARRFLSDNRKLLLLAEKTKQKYEDAKAPRTLVIDALLEVSRRRGWDSPGASPPSITVYHLTNSGQGPNIDTYDLPSEVVTFVALASRAGLAEVWSAIVARAWEKTSLSGKKKSNHSSTETLSPQAGKNRNFLYEDLFGLPHNAARFIRIYFLRRRRRYARPSDPRADYSYARDLDLISWPLVALFLKEILGMDHSRIEAIRTVADRIAGHITSRNDARLFQRLYMARRYNGLRTRLLQSSRERVTTGQAPLISFDEFIMIFEQAEDTPRIDWRLARDRLLIRLLDQLKDFFKKEPGVLQELTEEEEEATADNRESSNL
jgi:CRISPR-associated protein Cst1